MRLILAPLRGVTPLTFRRSLMHHFGGFDGAVSPFLTTVAGTKIKATHLSDIEPHANAFLPLVPQIIGKNPKEFATLLQAIRDLGYKQCDLNIGCPWPLVVKKGRGAGLLQNEDALKAMLDAGTSIDGMKLSVKVRLGIETTDLLEKRIELFSKYNLAEITIHARSAKQRYEGKVDLEAFERILHLAKAPIIYNGDILTLNDFSLIATRFPTISGIMIGRGAITNPALAKQIKCALDGEKYEPNKAQMRDFVLAYSEAVKEELCGPGSFLGRMKEFWSYHKNYYQNGEEIWQKLKTAKSYSDYYQAIEKAW